jgi:hypothetical protein
MFLNYVQLALIFLISLQDRRTSIRSKSQPGLYLKPAMSASLQSFMTMNTRPSRASTSRASHHALSVSRSQYGARVGFFYLNKIHLAKVFIFTAVGVKKSQLMEIKTFARCIFIVLKS